MSETFKYYERIVYAVMKRNTIPKWIGDINLHVDEQTLINKTNVAALEQMTECIENLEDIVRGLNTYCNDLYGYMMSGNEGCVPMPPREEHEDVSGTIDTTLCINCGRVISHDGICGEYVRECVLICDECYEELVL